MQLQSDILIDCIKDYVAEELGETNDPPNNIIARDIVDKYNKILMIRNQEIDEKPLRYKYVKELPPIGVVVLIESRYIIKNICFNSLKSKNESDMLAIYQQDGQHKGIYMSAEDEVCKIALEYNPNLSQKQCLDIVFALRNRAQRVQRTTTPYLVAVNNGVFNTETKELEDFRDDYIFTTKSYVNYIQDAPNPKRQCKDGSNWNVEDWVNELTDDEEIRQLLWQMIGSVIRPHVPWNKSIWLYSTVGNNGKGSLCKLMREICGESAWVSIPLSDFSKEFLLENLIGASAIITDENDVGLFIDKAANLKAVITGDTIQINRKFRKPINFSFKGMMIQCLNEMPKIKDKSDSFARRQLFVPMEKSFTGIEKKEIKDVFLEDQEVLEYVLYKVLNMEYENFIEPQACKMALEEYKLFNDPIRQFIDDLQDDLVWDFIPYPFLYDLYKEWYRENTPGGVVTNNRSFVNELKQVLDKTVWYIDPNPNNVQIINFSKPEPLIARYNLVNWMNKNDKTGEINKLCTPNISSLKSSYRGIKRISRKVKINEEIASDDIVL